MSAIMDVVTSNQSPKLPAGVPPWEMFSGLRVGIIAGGLVGGAVVALGVASIWPIFGGGVVGGTIGFILGRRRMRNPRPADEDR